MISAAAFEEAYVRRAKIWQWGLQAVYKSFTTWLAQELFAVLTTPIEEDQRLNATRQFISVFVDKMNEIPDHKRQQIVALLRQWEAQKAIAGKKMPNDNATTDWFEGITGTLDGILDQFR